MSKKILIALVLWASFASTTANAITANANALKCPMTASVGSPLFFNTTFTNNDCNNPVNMNYIVTTILSTASSVPYMQGPYATPTNGAKIPAATCQSEIIYPGYPQYGYHEVVINPGTLTEGVNAVAGVIPASMQGKLVAVSVGYLNEKNKLTLVGECNIVVQ